MKQDARKAVVEMAGPLQVPDVQQVVQTESCSLKMPKIDNRRNKKAARRAQFPGVWIRMRGTGDVQQSDAASPVLTVGTFPKTPSERGSRLCWRLR